MGRQRTKRSNNPNKENMILEKGKLITIKSNNITFIGIIDYISSEMVIYFKTLLRLEKEDKILSFNEYLTFKFLLGTEILKTSNEEYDILTLELDSLGLLLVDNNGLLDIRVPK